MLRAHSAINPEIKINDATVIAVTWGDDTASYHVINRYDVGVYVRMFGKRGAKVEELCERDIIALQNKGTWVGIMEATTSNVAAWGHAIIEKVQ